MALVGAGIDPSWPGLTRHGVDGWGVQLGLTGQARIVRAFHSSSPTCTAWAAALVEHLPGMQLSVVKVHEPGTEPQAAQLAAGIETAVAAGAEIICCPLPPSDALEAARWLPEVARRAAARDRMVIFAALPDGRGPISLDALTVHAHEACRVGEVYHLPPEHYEAGDWPRWSGCWVGPDHLEGTGHHPAWAPLQLTLLAASVREALGDVPLTTWREALEERALLPMKGLGLA